MAPLDVCSTEDAVQVFLEHLVDPLLAAKSSVRDNPTQSQQQSVAKQVHSVVLLYNYYHRKQYPELAYLPFNEFCKLIVVLRPPLLAYMQFMQKLNEAQDIDVEKQLSLTEKMIMDACHVCERLDASKNLPKIEGWPITKVAILLIDSKKECCILLFDSINKATGVWSMVEKSVDSSSQSSEVTSNTKNNYKTKRIIRKPSKDESKVDEAKLLQVGYSAVKEATGVNNTDIMLLESHTVYSHSKEKTASRFYIMQCSQWINQELIQVPLKDVIRSLQGPLVKKSSSSGWTISPVVDYLHVLPYSEIISKWISRETFSNSLHDSSLTEKKMMVESPEMKECDVCEDTFTGPDTKPGSDNIESSTPKVNSGNKGKCLSVANSMQADEDQENNKPSLQYNSNGSASADKAVKDDLTWMLIDEGSSEKHTMDDNTKASNHSNSDLEKFPILLDSEKKLSQTALNALIQKRNELSLQQRKIEDEIATCDEKIQRILAGEGEDNLELKIESIVEGCNDMLTWIQLATSEQQSISP